MKTMFTVGVIISTYNNPEWLRKTLWSYKYQTVVPNEVIIADDGSKQETKELIDSFRPFFNIKHVWHEDRGFQKSEILNKAVCEAESDYLIFTDQDCIAREDFVETHIRYAKQGQYLSAGYVRMSMEVSNKVTEDDVKDGNVFKISWLRRQGMDFSFKLLKLIRAQWFSKLMNVLTPAHATWNGCNSSGWKSDILAVNGFNQDMHYGGQDREFGYRLVNMGLSPKRIRFSAIAMHLDHKRPYKTTETMEFNKRIMNETREKKVVKTRNGIECLS